MARATLMATGRGGRGLQALAKEATALEEEQAIDPTREEMCDGVFDLHEMEACADKEEEMLPDDNAEEMLPDEAARAGEGGRCPLGERGHRLDQGGVMRRLLRPARDGGIRRRGGGDAAG